MTSDNEEMSRVANKKPKKGGKMKLWKKILLSLIGIGVLVLLAGIGLFAYYASSAPNLTEKELNGSFSSKILDSKGNVFKEIGGENREIVEGEQIPQSLKDAVISIEDRRFYKHIGIDPIRIGGAVLANLKGGFASQGGSTLTQQLVKLSVFSTKSSDQTLKRKAQEAWLSLKLERKYSKEQILEFYINKVYLANNVYGVGKASQYYFGKPLNEISLSQAALLAGMPQAPNSYNPYTNPDEALARRNMVLDAMASNEKITAAERDAAKAEPINSGLVDHTEESADNLVIDAYLKEVIEEVSKKTDVDIYTDGVTVHTNLDMDAQQHLYDTLNTENYVKYPDDQIQAGVSMVDVNNGQIKALGGSRKQTAQLGLNRATDLQRSIGSTMKPLADYAPAIENLNYSTYQQVVDAPYTYSDGKTQIKNYDKAYKGQMSIREAITDSRNIPALKTLQTVGLDKSNEFLKKVGINIKQPDGYEGLVESNAIGGDVTPVQLSASYAAFANGGTYYQPYAVNKVVLRNNQEIDLTSKGETAMKDSTAYMMTDMLKDVIKKGTGTAAEIPGLAQAGKTGTTNYDDKIADKFPSTSSPDAWFSGYTTNYSISVWVGYDDPNADNHDLNPNSQKLPARIYKELMTHVSKDIETKDWKKPATVVSSPVLNGSNPAAKPGPNVPSSNIVTELFVKGTAPTNTSNGTGNTPETLPAPTGLTASYNKETDAISISWDSYKSSSKNAKVSYLLNVNGQTYETSDLSYTVQRPTSGTNSISLVASVSGQRSATASTSVQVDSKEAESSSESVIDSTEPPASSEASSEIVPPESSSSETSSSTPPPDTSSGGNGSDSSSTVVPRSTRSKNFSSLGKFLWIFNLK